MNFINVEIKARCFHPQKVRAFLLAAGADFKGTDYQKDTYFNVPEGRLKLRQGNIEQNLIYYNRPNIEGPKQSDFSLLPVTDGAAMEAFLLRALGEKVVVEKTREIYFIENVKFHIDELTALGSFVEIEAGNKNYPHLTVQELQQQCNDYMKAFDISDSDLIHVSYSDMILSLL